jgi:DNA-binding transcriptional LysR family regulator
MATLRQLEYLVAAADLGSITRAAVQEHVSQPALSHQIAALERSVGGPLLERLPRSVRLTPAGRALLPHARGAIVAAARATSAARQATGAEAGEIHVAAVFSVSLGILPAPLRAWRRQRPGVTVRLHEYRHADEMLEAMRAGAADVAVGPAPERWEGVVRSLGDEELVVVIPPDDPLAGLNKPIDLRQLSDRGWVHYAAGHGLGDVLDAACESAGFRPLVALRTEQTATAPLLAAAGIGPTLAPASALPADFDGVVLPTAPPTRRAMAVYHRRNPDPLTAAFAEDLTQTAQLVPDHVAQRLHALG